ncbi:MAG: right-handed parallel beta-helix repeat-containing protein [Rhodobacteraceae bacterium]|nr:right-handed parallel beta-helix repeat-containing protein [Paracoccaceae bacterium]
MNKAITDGLQLMPPVFADGLNVWSSGDGTPGSDLYSGSPNAALVPADADFGGCLEVLKTESTQKLRYTGQTPLLPGCYLQITARVKAISGNFPTVRVAGWAGDASGANVSGVIQIGPARTLDTYGEVVEISAIVGVGSRGGVNMVWGPAAIYGHFGIDLVGANGGVVRVDDIEITDITGVFLRDLLGLVDVRDYGAIGNGVTDDSAAFEAADAAANGRRVMVSQGVYHLAGDVTIDSPVTFVGTVTMPDDKVLVLAKDYDLPSYSAAFGDDTLGFKKAFQALLNNAAHESLDLGGRKINLTEPLDMQAAVSNRNTYATRRLIRNGQFEAQDGPGWDTTVTTSQATYDPGDAYRLSNVVNVANISDGALVTGIGVGREVYVRSRNIAQQQLTLSAPLFDAAGSQVFSFTRFRYLLDFGGFQQLSLFSMTDIEFQCRDRASGILLADSGIVFQLRDCFISRPKDRGITSKGSGCQGMHIDRCQFLSAEDALEVPQRVSIGFNTNANDVKVRNNRATRLRHFGVLGGSNNQILGNHFFQGDGVANGVRTAGLVIASGYCSTVISGNYIDNCFVEWTNEYDPTPDHTSGFSFSAFTMTDNVCLASNVAPWFSYLVVKPHGAGHFLNGVSVQGNRFRCTQVNIDRVERVDTSFADLDFSRFKDVTFAANSYNQVNAQVKSPLRVQHTENTASDTWMIDPDGEMPFGGRCRGVDAVVVNGDLRNAGNVKVFAAPSVFVERGPNSTQAELRWADDYSGAVTVIMRCDT